MIDTKIACQCGNRFKFGMDLVNGRAPDGLVCPTCGAPATPACNALVDFLSGKEPAPPSAGTRPVKEVKVTCACGARYKFDIELAEKEMPSPVVCPGCQADLTTQANEEIRNYIAKHAADLATPSPAPAPAAPVAAAAVPAAEPVPASPVSSIPSAPVPVTPPSAATPSATPSPAPPTAAPTVSPPSAAALPATPVSDPFGPSPTGKSSGPNLKPLEAPKPNRPPPGSKPATPPAKPGAPAAASAPKAATPAGAKPEAAKPAAKPKPAAASREPNFGMGVAGAVGGALVGAVIWFILLKVTPMTAGWMALLVGLLAGFGARLLGRGPSPQLGGAACISATVVIVLMVWVAMGRHIDRQMAPQMKTQYDAALANAQAAVKATDAELKLIIARSIPNADIDGARVSDEVVKAYRATELPKHRAFLEDKNNRAKFESRQRALYRSMYPMDELWQESFGILGLLFLLAGIMAAAKIPMK